MQEKKAVDIRVIDLRAIPHAVTDYFILCSGSSPRQVEAIADAVVASSYQRAQEHPWQQEGRIAKEWILIDYVDVVVHVFHAEKRDFYALEALWSDAPTRSVHQDRRHADDILDT